MESIDREDAQLGRIGHPKFERSLADNLGVLEHGIGASVGGGFDGIEKTIDSDLYDDDGKPRRTGQLLFSLVLLYTLC